MAGKQKQGPDSSDVLEETLGRLVRKAGVKAAILVDRKSGAILKMEGQIATIRTSLRTRGKNGAGDGSNLASDAGVGFDGGPKAGDMPEDETQGAREMAALVWKYVNVSDQLVSALDAEVCVPGQRDCSL